MTTAWKECLTCILRIDFLLMLYYYIVLAKRKIYEVKTLAIGKHHQYGLKRKFS